MTTETDDRSLVIDRVIPAPVERIWAAWTDPNRLPHWWGPRGFTCRTHEIDIAEGGQWRFDMIAPDGTVYPNRHRFRRIAPMERIDYTLDDDGAGMHSFEATVRFRPVDGGTAVTLTMVTPSPEERAAMQRFGAVAHGHTTLDCLTEAALGPDALSLSRVLDATPERIWAAWTDPDALAAWCVPADLTVTAAAADIREGGAWSCRMQDANGGIWEPGGTYAELTRPRRIVFTHGWRQADGTMGPLSRVAVEIAPTHGGTRLTLLQTGLGDAARRDGHAQGWSETLDNLARHLA